MQAIDPKSRSAMLANVDIAACTAFELMTAAECKSRNAVREKLCMQVAKHVSTWMKDKALPKPAADADWVVDALLAAAVPDDEPPVAEGPKATEKRPVEAVHVPTVATFDEASGKMVTAPVGCTVPIPTAESESKKPRVSAAPTLACTVPWERSIREAAKKPNQPGPDAKHIGAVAFVMQHLLQQQSIQHEENSATSQGIQVVYEAPAFKVKAAWDLKPGELTLLPIVTDAKKITTASHHPQALPVEVITIFGTQIAPDEPSSREDSQATGSSTTDAQTVKKPKGKRKLAAVADAGSVVAAVAAEPAPPSDLPCTEKSTVYIAPDMKLPVAKKHPPTAESAGDVYLEWTGDEKVQPFWVVRRLTTEQLEAENKKNKATARFNCEIKAKECHLVSIVGGTGCTKKIMVPMLTNRDAVRSNEELILQTFPAQKKAVASERHWTDAIKTKAKR